MKKAGAMLEHKFKKGYDIKLAGAAGKLRSPIEKPKQYALQPPDFLGIKPKLQINIGKPFTFGTIPKDRNKRNEVLIFQDMHPTPLTHRILAEEFYPFIADRLSVKTNSMQTSD